jgi:spermidine/putrescine-binding protein
MKKFLSVFLLALLLAALCACNKNNGTGNSEKPENLTQNTYYDYTTDGFFLVKEFTDKNGNVIKEVAEGIDSSFDSY